MTPTANKRDTCLSNNLLGSWGRGRVCSRFEMRFLLMHTDRLLLRLTSRLLLRHTNRFFEVQHQVIAEAKALVIIEAQEKVIAEAKAYRGPRS